jgi:predicted nuclease with TOPRIM domain
MTKLKELEQILSYSKKMNLKEAYSAIHFMIQEELAKNPELVANKIVLNKKIAAIKSVLKTYHEEQKKLKVEQKKAEQSWVKDKANTLPKQQYLSLTRKIAYNRLVINSSVNEISELKAKRQES